MLNYRFTITHTVHAEIVAETTYDAIVGLCDTHLIPLDSDCTTLHALKQHLLRQGYTFKELVPDVDYTSSPYHF
jgi:hypothetical protein